MAVLTQAPAGSGDTVALRVSDRVGDTLDAAERESLGLFPGVPGFVRARFAAGPGSDAYAFVDYDRPEGRASASLPLSPTQLERIRFLARNAESVRRDEGLNVYAGLAVRRFWSEVELAGSFSGYAPWGAGGEATPEWLGKAYVALHGATAGSACGGCAASWTAAKEVSPGGCDAGAAVYSVNQPLFCGITGGTTLLGVAGGLALAGDAGSDMFESDLTNQRGAGWRTGLTTFLMTIPGIALGGLFAYVAHYSLYGHDVAYGVDVQNDNGWRLVSAIFTGACITVEFAALGYKWGRSWEQARARRVARTGYAWNRQPAEADTARSSSR
jgi:hypothetical protein